MVQYNLTSVVVLALVVMMGCAITGMILGDVGPFNSQVAEAKIPAQQTQGALDSMATQAALGLAQTRQAPVIQQTAISAQMTMAPLQQTATQVALNDALQFVQANATQTIIASDAQRAQVIAQATQTSIANDLYIRNLTSNATVTAIAQGQAQYQSTIYPMLFAFFVLAVCSWIIARAISQMMVARTRLLAEQRLTASQATQQVKKNGHQRYPLPNSLMKNINNGNGLPKAK